MYFINSLKKIYLHNLVSTDNTNDNYTRNVTIDVTGRLIIINSVTEYHGSVLISRNTQFLELFNCKRRPDDCSQRALCHQVPKHIPVRDRLQQ